MVKLPKMMHKMLNGMMMKDSEMPINMEENKKQIMKKYLKKK